LHWQGHPWGEHHEALIVQYPADIKMQQKLILTQARPNIVLSIHDTSKP
jgi:hypothetical protein